MKIWVQGSELTPERIRERSGFAKVKLCLSSCAYASRLFIVLFLAIKIKVAELFCFVTSTISYRFSLFRKGCNRFGFEVFTFSSALL